MIEGLLFDLDDTLYLESDFVASGYRAVAAHVARRCGCPVSRVYYAMMSVFGSQGRQSVFPFVVNRFSDACVTVPELVDLYRGHTPRLRLYPGYARLLRSFRRRYATGIITDGLPQVQRRKVAALGLAGLVDEIVYTWEYGTEKEKPHPFCFSLMADALKVAPGNTVFIGDNAAKDCRGARRVGMKAARVRAGSPASGSDAGDETADFVIDSLFQLEPILQH
jgi:putative hydrolase of the HAD superfamily